MSQANQALWFNAVPLLVIAAAYLGATALVGPTLWAERRGASLLDVAIFLVFPAYGLAAAAYGVALAVERRPLAGGVWVTFGVALATGLPAFVALARWRERTTLASGPRHGRQLESMAAITTALGRTDDPATVAGALLEQVEGLVHAELACLILVDDEIRKASGLVGRVRGRELDWFPEVRIDLDNEPSGVATAAHEGSPFAVYDAGASKVVSPRMVEATGAKSVAFVPLIADERVIAVLVVGTVSEHRAFATEELTLLQTIAGEAALGLRVARLLRENERRIAQQGALLRAAQALTSDLELATVLERLVEQVAELLAAAAADCYLYDETRNVLRCEAVHGLPEDLVGFEFAADRGVAGAALRSGRPVITDNFGDPRQSLQGDADAEFTGGLIAPMLWSETVLGVLGVGTHSERGFAQEDADLLEAYAGIASLALANSQAFSARSRQARVQRGFFRIAAALGQSLSLSATLEALAQAATEALGGAFATVLMPRGTTLEPAASAGLPDVLAKALEDGLPESAACLGAAAADSRVLASPDVSRDDRFEKPWQELAAAAGYRALLAVPVASPRAERAGLVIVFFAAERVFIDDDLELARHLGDAARGALERSELFEAERTARALSQQLARTGGVLATELDPAAVLDEVVQQAPMLLGADACAVRTIEDDELVVSAASGKGAEDAVGTRASASAWLSGDVFQSRSPLALEDTSTDERLLEADPIVAAGYAAYLGVPLSGPEGALAGVLAVYARRPRTWRPEEIEALLALAANTSAALANAELYSRVSLEKERSVAILANIADGIVAVDRDGKVVLWNAAAEDITGVPQEEAIGHTTVQVLQRRLEADEDEVHSGQRLTSIMRGGEEVWLSLSEAVMRDPLGAVAGRIFAFRDISADRMVEQVKSDFVAAVSHELRTPLTSIYGFAETLLRQDIPFGEDERRTFLGYIASESERLTEIVDQLLNVARLDAGDLQVELGRIDVGSVVSEVVETVEESGVMNGHRFEVDLPEEPLAAEADPDKVRQVFNILVENALRYSPKGGTVTVGARRNADRVEVRVVDEGMGIPASEREWIFRKFYRAESAARDGAAGTGLGLFIAKELVTAMGGRIWVDSTEGEGSSFAFELPAARE